MKSRFWSGGFAGETGKVACKGSQWFANSLIPVFSWAVTVVQYVWLLDWRLPGTQRKIKRMECSNSEKGQNLTRMSQVDAELNQQDPAGCFNRLRASS